MAGLGDLASLSVIEKDSNGDVLWTWCFPAVTPAFRQIVMRKCCLNSEKGQELVSFCYGQLQRKWYYLYTTDVKNSSVMPKVTHVTVVLLAKDFHPEKYRSLTRLLSSGLLDTGNPAEMLEQYLSVLTKGICSDSEDGSMFNLKEYNPRAAFLEKSLKDVVNIFGVETILVYTALLLKKRVAVYTPRLPTLLDITRTLPVLVWHRQNWSILHPYVDLEEDEIEELKSSVTYIAGFTDASIENRTDLYDLLMNVATGEVTIPTHAKETFQMGKVHKDIAMFMVEASKNEEMSDQAFIKELTNKTKDLVNNLQKLGVDTEDGKPPKITLDGLRQRKLTAIMENFLFNLAAAEGLV
ncbi:DENN domain-containing protein 10 isoform X2 [Nematostella vectensis]|uniref:DENN domain-containing protein 10 isoform X2 n=1 Tax=Nematostella vectensis TaxID=45351 RepID=UPI0020777449|nr:DENN domain-containing protein 10 isoform X2 [Nematostella vectensis]